MTEIFAFFVYFPIFGKGTKDTAFNATESNVLLPKLPFDVIFHFLSLIVKKIEYQNFHLQKVLWPWVKGQGQIFLACHILLSKNNDNRKTKGFTQGIGWSQIFGKCVLELHPSWNLGGNILECTESFECLGAVMSNKSSHHIAKRLKACRQGFYSLQSAGMHNRGCNPRIVSYLWKAALQPTITYANECFSTRNYDIHEMEKLLKCSLGLSKYSNTCTSPFLDSLSVKHILNVTDSNSLKLFKKIITAQQTQDVKKTF